jgi:hypothetical protein
VTISLGFDLNVYKLTVINPDPTLGVLTAGARDGNMYCGRPEEPQPQKCEGLYYYGEVAIVSATPDPPATGVRAFDNCTSATPPPFLGPGSCQIPMTRDETMTVHWLGG